MQYQINTTNYCTFETFEVNKLPGRSYFIPYPTKDAADAVSPKEKRYASEKVQCLNGDWDFKFYMNPKDVPEVLDTDKTEFDKIDVPACWQFRGYYHPFYVNIRYQFPFKPPKIPTTEPVGRCFTWMGVDQKISLRYHAPKDEYNFVGIYRKFISVEHPEKRHVISFLGVASCLDLYLNGEFIGYSEGAHNTAEFDLTGKLKDGDNEMVAVVHRWCNGTYLEDQDMFRNNGIFRDVLLREEEETDFWDLNSTTEKTGDTYKLTLEAETLTDTDVTFSISGHGIEQSMTVQTQNKKAQAVFEDLDVTEWTAEDPVLYDTYFETCTGCVKNRVGFKSVTIDKTVFLVNGKKIKFKGVNHHETSPTNGYTMTPDEIEKDVQICKDYNIDTIRTSHYPPDPLLLELAEELGIYVVDENDLETHGTWSCQMPPTYNTISNNPKWQSHYMDRITRLYERDKMRSCIVMWSLGNEAGGYANTDAMYDFLKSRSSLPVHYESAVHCKRIAYDVGSEMYPTPQMVHDVGEKCRREKELNNRPYFMCEYAHAMGVGPGDMEAYWKEIYHYDNLMGGCVWEMVDHGVLQEDGHYTYGGDHGEWEHDGNFCVDGMFYPDRTPSTGAYITKFIYRPIRVRHVEGDTYEIFNTTAFSEGSRYQLDIVWNDGTTETITPEAGPLSRTRVQLKTGESVGGEVRAIVTTTDLKTGKVVSTEELDLREDLDSAIGNGPLPENFKIDGLALTMNLPDGTEMTFSDPATILFRAKTDNDTNDFFANLMEPYYDEHETLVSCDQTANGVQVVTRVSNKKNTFTVTDTYEGCNGGILVTSHIHTESGRGILPRYGKAFKLPEIFDEVEYTGRTGESYIDMKEQFPIDVVHTSVENMTEPNIRPQESGNRCDCTYASVSDGKVKITFRAVEKPFELSIKPYTDKALINMKHTTDEKRTGTYVTIEAFQQGIGTGACGPNVAPIYQYPVLDDYSFKFLIQVEEY